MLKADSHMVLSKGASGSEYSNCITLWCYAVCIGQSQSFNDSLDLLDQNNDIIRVIQAAARVLDVLAV